MRVAVLAILSILMLWVLLLLVLAVARPRGMDFRAAKAFVPDLLRLIRSLARDPATSRGVRIRLGLLLAYLASPIDLVPDFIPVLGYADDLIVVSLVLRSVVRRVGAEVLTQHWTGSEGGLLLVRRVAGLDRPPAS